MTCAAGFLGLELARAFVVAGTTSVEGSGVQQVLNRTTVMDFRRRSLPLPKIVLTTKIGSGITHRWDYAPPSRWNFRIGAWVVGSRRWYRRRKRGSSSRVLGDWNTMDVCGVATSSTLRVCVWMARSWIW